MRARPGTIEEKVGQLQELEARATAQQLAEYTYRIDLSWIHHDSAIEGTVYEPGELVAAINDKVVSDSSLIPVYDEIRQFKAAIDQVRAMAQDKKLPVDLEVVRALYCTLAPEDADAKGPLKYRKDIPLHRVYFHEIAPPDKIAYKMRKLFEWLSAEDTQRTMHPTRIASRAHYKLVHIFPFTKHSGKVARLLMNLLMMRAGYPPAILHATDRQRYYEALKTSSDATATVVLEALENAIESRARYWRRMFGIEEPV